MRIVFAVCIALVALPTAAHSDPGGIAAMSAGLLHPLTGLDHLLAMVGIGLWGRQQQTHGLALVFLAGMVASALAFGGAALPAAGELSLAGGVALVGTLVAVGRKAAQWAAYALVALLGLLHGQAHAAEVPTLAGAAGFLLSSAALLMTGRLLAASSLQRKAGMAIGVSGIGLLAGFA
jgi:urease accessory protein